MSRNLPEARRFRVAAESAFDHIIITDKDGTVVYANHGAELATGYSIDEMIGSKPSLWGGLMPKAFYEEMWDTIQNKKLPFIGEIVNRRKTGETYTAELHISPVVDKNNEIVHFVGIERDVTKLRELDASRLEFVTLASHQLRTPLSTLSWYSEVLLSGDIGKLSKTQEQYTREMYKASQRMIALVNDLLNLSRIDMGKIHAQSTELDLVQIVNQIIHEHRAFAFEKNIEIEFKENEPINMHTDEQLLRNIIANLLSNAIKYTPRGGKILLSAKEDKQHLIFKIKDSGYGIPAKDKAKIFSKFFRANNVKVFSSDGTGLGLYIVQAFTQSLGGKVSFESKENEGTEFTVSIPIVLKEDNDKH